MDKISLRSLEVADGLQFLSQFDKQLTAHLPSKQPAAFIERRTAFTAHRLDLDTAFKNDPASRHTAELLALDAVRDQYIAGLLLRCESDTNHYDAEVRANGLLLHRSLEVYGSGISRQKQNEETATLRSIVSDWRTKQALTGAMNALGLDGWIDAIEEANNAFDNKFLERTEEAVAEKRSFSLAEKRADMAAAYRELVLMIEGLCLLSEDPAPWKALADQLDSVTEEYSQMLAAKAGRAERKAKA